MSGRASGNGRFVLPILSVSGNLSLTAAQIKSYQLFAVTTGSSANVVLTLPDPALVTGYPIKLQKVDSGTKFAGFAPNGAENIRGVNSNIYALAQNESLELVSDGSNYILLSDPVRVVSALLTPAAASGTSQYSVGSLYSSGSWVSSVSNTVQGYSTVTWVSGVFTTTPAAQISGTNKGNANYFPKLDLNGADSTSVYAVCKDVNDLSIINEEYVVTLRGLK